MNQSKNQSKRRRTIMSKLSDLAIILFIIGTILINLSFLLVIIIFPFRLNIILIISGWIICFIALIFTIKTRNEYRIIKLKNGFPLKIGQLILFICAMSMAISFGLMVDIVSYRYTGKFSLNYFTFGWILFAIVSFTILSIRIRSYHPN